MVGSLAVAKSGVETAQEDRSSSFPLGSAVSPRDPATLRDFYATPEPTIQRGIVSVAAQAAGQK